MVPALLSRFQLRTWPIVTSYISAIWVKVSPRRTRCWMLTVFVGSATSPPDGAADPEGCAVAAAGGARGSAAPTRLPRRDDALHIEIIPAQQIVQRRAELAGDGVERVPLLDAVLDAAARDRDGA